MPMTESPITIHFTRQGFDAAREAITQFLEDLADQRRDLLSSPYGDDHIMVQDEIDPMAISALGALSEMAQSPNEVTAIEEMRTALFPD
jgi:hypothetical protein